jgi:hypothetical protein
MLHGVACLPSKWQDCGVRCSRHLMTQPPTPLFTKSRDDPQDFTTTNTYDWKCADFDGHAYVLVVL